VARASAIDGVPGRIGPSNRSLLPERALVLLREARWLVLCATAMFLVLILISYDKGDPGWSNAVAGRDVHNFGGRLGAWLADLLLYLFGACAYLLAIFMLMRVVSGYRHLNAARLADRRQALDETLFGWDRWLGFALLFVGCLALESSRLSGLPMALPLAPGGVVGHLLAQPALVHLGADVGTVLMLLAVAVVF
jgi:S-DNA-T family DNA segregation ATPase FtsK/SpoIIIE